MLVSEIISAIKSLAENDQTISDADAVVWINQGINRINQSLKSSFETITIEFDDSFTPGTPQFDNRFHESLVVFGVAKYRESDADYSSASYFMQQFNDMVVVMQRDMVVPVVYRADDGVQQINITDDTVLTYTLSMPLGSYFDVLSVYQTNVTIANSPAVEVDSSLYSINVGKRTITFKSGVLADTNILTIVFEVNSDLNNPPYGWWGNSGW